LDSARESVSKRDLLAASAGAAAWFSPGIVAYTGGGADRVAALPPLPYLLAAVVLAIVAARVARIRLADAWPLAISFLIFLPFIPGSVPAAFMLWQGPIEMIVWLLVAAGLILRFARGPAALRDSPRACWLAAVVVALFAAFAFIQVREVVPSGDEPHYLVATQSLIADLDLKVENNYAAGDYLNYFGGRLQAHFMQRSTTGEIYSIHAPGVSVVVLPAFLAFGYLGAVFTVIAIVALSATVTWALAWRLTKSAGAAWIGTLSVYATAPFVFHSFTIYPEGIGALIVIGAAWLIAHLDDERPPQFAILALTGAGLAMLPWLHTRFAILAAVFGAAIVLRLRVQRASIASFAAFLSLPIVAAAGWFAFFWMVYGTPSPMAAYGRDTGSSLSYIGRGLVGLLVDQQHGVLGTAPIYAIAFLGFLPLYRQKQFLGLTIAVASAVYVIAVSTYAMWWGGTSAPARFLAAVLPLAAVTIAMAWASFPRLRTAMLLLLLVSITLVWPRLTEDSGRMVFNSRNAFDPTIEWLSRNVDLSLALPSGHRDGPALALRDALPWLGALGAVLAASLAASRTRAGAGARWTMVTLAGAITVMGTSTVVWALRSSEPVTIDRSTIGSLANHRSWHTVHADLSGAFVITQQQYLSRLSTEARADDTAALVRLRRVPAGEYEITALDGAPAPIAASVNRTDPMLETGSLPFRLRLPVPVGTLNIRAEAASPEGTQTIRITPVGLDPSPLTGSRVATRAARYGRARVFVFDERVYLEPAGFWTRAEGGASIVIDADEHARQNGLPIAITGGAAATTIGIAVGEWSQSYSMTPGQRREITLPPLAGEVAWLVRIHSGPGFRPFEREPGNADVRSLAAWFQIP
jgi:hypothetical protein